MAEGATGIAWNYTRTSELIVAYETYPCLYNTRIKEYKDRAKRNTALLELAQNFATRVKIVW